MQVSIFGKNYITVVIVALFMVLLCATAWLAYSIYFSGNALIKVPLLNNVFIAKNTDSEFLEKILFDKYLSYMSNLEYIYLPGERMGGSLSFKKDGKRVLVPYPRFVRIKQGVVD